LLLQCLRIASAAVERLRRVVCRELYLQRVLVCILLIAHHSWLQSAHHILGSLIIWELKLFGLEDNLLLVDAGATILSFIASAQQRTLFPILDFSLHFGHLVHQLAHSSQLGLVIHLLFRLLLLRKSHGLPSSRLLSRVASELQLGVVLRVKLWWALHVVLRTRRDGPAVLFLGSWILLTTALLHEVLLVLLVDQVLQALALRLAILPSLLGHAVLREKHILLVTAHLHVIVEDLVDELGHLDVCRLDLGIESSSWRNNSEPVMHLLRARLLLLLVHGIHATLQPGIATLLQLLQVLILELVGRLLPGHLVELVHQLITETAPAHVQGLLVLLIGVRRQDNVIVELQEDVGSIVEALLLSVRLLLLEVLQEGLL